MCSYVPSSYAQGRGRNLHNPQIAYCCNDELGGWAYIQYSSLVCLCADQSRYIGEVSVM